MAGKNDCGMAGKGWREMGGGKRVAGNSWREHMAGKGCAEYVIVKKNGDRSGKKMVACTSRPTAGQLVPVGPQLAN